MKDIKFYPIDENCMDGLVNGYVTVENKNKEKFVLISFEGPDIEGGWRDYEIYIPSEKIKELLEYE